MVIGFYATWLSRNSVYMYKGREWFSPNHEKL